MKPSRAFLTLSLVCTRVRCRLPGEDRDPKAAAELAVSSVGTRDHRYDARAAAGQHNQSVGCQQLASKYPDLVFYSNSANYTYDDHHFWSTTAILSPSCVFTPMTAQDVAGGLAVLVQTNTHFGLRSGGHMPIAGYASTNDGVLIGTTNLNILELAPMPNTYNHSYLKLGPANRFGDVYVWLDDRDLVIYGGRVTTVGTSLLLGGGISYLSGEGGWACDNIVNIELVTADSKILQVNKQTYPDLFWALKGGSNNYGIVTRYDVKTFPRGTLYGGTVTWSKAQVPAYLEAQTSYIVEGGGSDDPKSAIMPDFQITPLTGDQSASSVLFYDAADPSPKALENFTAIPTNQSTLGLAKMGQLTNSTAAFGALQLREEWRATALISTSKTMALINDTVINDATSRFSKLNVTIGAAVEPITPSFLQKARENGGDAINLDPADGRFVVCLLYARWPDEDDDAAVKSGLDFMLGDLDAKSKLANLHYDFVFLNDAGEGQKPFATYGKGKSLPRMRKVARKYDPGGVFQKLTGGFKLG